MEGSPKRRLKKHIRLNPSGISWSRCNDLHCLNPDYSYTSFAQSWHIILYFNMSNSTSQPALDPVWAAQDKGPMIIIGVCILVSIQTMFLAARICTKALIRGKLHLDDYLITFSVVSCFSC